LHARGQEDDGHPARLFVLAQLARRLVAVDTRHHHVDNGEIRSPGERHSDGLLAVPRLDDLVSRTLESKRNESEDVRIVVGDQDERLTVPGHSASSSTGSFSVG
jgi:hypothetical protein